MARHQATTEQTRIIDHAEHLFDLDWSQATGDDTINLDVLDDDLEDLIKFMSLHDYKFWTEYRRKGDYLDVSFMQE